MAEPAARSSFARRLLMTTGVVLLAVLALWFLWRAGMVLLLGFAGVLLAVFLDSLARPLYCHTRLSRGWALLLVSALLFALIGLMTWLLGPKVADQMAQLLQQLPEALNKIHATLRAREWGRTLLDQLGQLGGGGNVGTRLLAQASGVVYSLLGILTQVAVVIFLGAYLAVRPALYRHAMILLIPPTRRMRFQQLLMVQGHALRRWLLGRLLSMLVVGVLTALGLWLIGMPLALTLGLIAGLLSFIPYLGPALSAFPAILIALLQGGPQVFYVLGLYLLVQTVESYLVTPLIQQRAVSIPPAYQIAAQLTAGLIAGALGVLLATPIAVIITVAVQMLYVEDVLGDRVTPLGE